MSNRIDRLEFLFWIVASVLGGAILLGIVAGITHTAVETERTQLPVPQALCAIFTAVVILKATASRFHDVGWSTWSLFLTFVPLVGLVVFLGLLFVPGQKRSNRYGDPPIFLQRFRKLAEKPVSALPDLKDSPD